jgi:hypothetical protein
LRNGVLLFRPVSYTVDDQVMELTDGDRREWSHLTRLDERSLFSYQERFPDDVMDIDFGSDKINYDLYTRLPVCGIGYFQVPLWMIFPCIKNNTGLFK